MGLFTGRRICLGLLFSFLLLALPAFASGGSCPSGSNYLDPASDTPVTLSSLGIRSCYYIAANGSDSNSGTSEASPWQHAPQMPNCSANCAAAQNQGGGIPPGTGLILRGGDTWHFGTSTAPATGGTWNFNTGQYPMGTSSNPIYVGVDQAWFSGSSWARPILTGDNPTSASTSLSSCSHQTSGDGNDMIDISGLQYYIIDNFEMTGLCQSSVGQPGGNDTYVRYGSLRATSTFTNLYIHGWTHVRFAGPNGSGSCTGSNVCFNIFAFQGSVIGGGAGEVIQNVVVDGSDSDPAGAGLCFGGFYDVSNSVFRYTSQCVTSTLHTFHDNLYEYFFENGHSNVLESSNNEFNGNNTVYNNVFRHLETSGGTGGVGMWLFPTAGNTDYVFNNMMYDVGSMELVNIGNHGSTVGSYTIFNNTFQTSISQSIFNNMYLSGGMLTDSNNQFIDDGSPYQASTNRNSDHASIMSNSSAASAGYSASGTYAFAPTSAGSPTVGTGTNRQGYCSALSGAAATACQSDTTYACSYNMGNNTVSCPMRNVTARASSGAWDIGAQAFGTLSTQNPPPTAPTGLQATVN